MLLKLELFIIKLIVPAASPGSAPFIAVLALLIRNWAPPESS